MESEQVCEKKKNEEQGREGALKEGENQEERETLRKIQSGPEDEACLCWGPCP